MRSVGEVGEFELIRRLSKMIPSSPSVIEGIGDDCAVLRVGDRYLLASTDLFIEGVHFTRAYTEPADIGLKAAAACLSDVAAMGGAPLFCMVSLACPQDTRVAYLEELWQGMCGEMGRLGAALVGGDTTRLEDRILIDVVAIGQALGQHYLRRRGARAGDLLVVTGYPGMSAAGLHALRNDHEAKDCIAAHLRPRPRIPEGQWLCSHGTVHAMLDVSDGLVQDAGHLLETNGLGIDIDPDALPVAEALSEYCHSHQLHARDFILAGGEDYELLFAMHPDNHQRTLQDFRHEFSTGVTVIGSFTDAWTGVRVAGEPVGASGFDHFRCVPPED